MNNPLLIGVAFVSAHGSSNSTLVIVTYDCANPANLGEFGGKTVPPLNPFRQQSRCRGSASAFFLRRSLMIKPILLAAVATCMTASANAQMAPAGAMSGDPMTAPTMAPDYVKDAGAGDMFEIQSSKLVLQSTHDPKVRAFANKMIADHMKSTAMVKAAARKDHVTVPAPMLMPMQQQMLTDIRSATGAARDAVYMKDQATAHQAALMVQQSYAQGGDKPALMATAGQIVPVVQSHIDMLNSTGSMSGM